MVTSDEMDVKTWFQEHGNGVHDGPMNPNHQAASILNKTAATWLHKPCTQ